MAAQSERESGVVAMSICSNVLDPMAQDIPEQDIVMGELELPRKWTQSLKWPRRMTPPLPLSTKTPQSLPKRLTQEHPAWPNYSPCWRK